MTMAIIIIAINLFNIYSKIDTLYNELIKFNLWPYEVYIHIPNLQMGKLRF